MVGIHRFSVNAQTDIFASVKYVKNLRIYRCEWGCDCRKQQVYASKVIDQLASKRPLSISNGNTAGIGLPRIRM